MPYRLAGVQEITDFSLPVCAHVHGCVHRCACVHVCTRICVNVCSLQVHSVCACMGVCALCVNVCSLHVHVCACVGVCIVHWYVQCAWICACVHVCMDLCNVGFLP